MGLTAQTGPPAGTGDCPGRRRRGPGRVAATMRRLELVGSRRLAWREAPEPTLQDPTDALVRPFLAARCDGDTLPLHHPVSRALQLGMAIGAVDRVVGCICGS